MVRVLPDKDANAFPVNVKEEVTDPRFWKFR